MQAPNSKRVRRIYKGADAQMLATCLVQLDNLIPIQADLAKRRKKVTAASLTALRKEVADAIEQQLGLSPSTLVQELTGQVMQAQSTALGLLRSFNLDLRDAFLGAPDKARLQQLLTQLGFRDHYTAAIGRSQSSLAELLTKFHSATSDATLRTELEDTYDIAPDLIDDLRAQQKFYELDVAQEQGKSTTPVVTDDTIRLFNDLYRRVQSLARLARDLNKTDDARAAQFSYSQLRRKMTGGVSAPASPPNP